MRFINKRFVMLIALVLALTSVFGFSPWKKKDESAAQPVYTATPNPVDDQWEKFQSEISVLVGERLITKLCEGYNKFEDIQKRNEIEKKYNKAAVDYIISEITGKEALEKFKATPVYAVLDFAAIGKSDRDMVQSAEGEEIAERLSTMLANVPQVKVVDRSKIKKVIEEIKFQQTDYFDSNKSKQLGGMLGADALIYGTLGKEMYVKLVDCGEEAGVIKRGVPLDRPYFKNIPMTANSIVEEIKRIPEVKKIIDENPFGLTVWTDKKEYKIGEQTQFFFRAEKDCYITLVAIQHDESADQLYPNTQSKDGWIKAGTRYAIPAIDDSFAIQTEGPAGLQRIVAFSSDAPLEFIPKSTPAGENIFKSINMETAMQLTRDLKISAKKNSEKMKNWGVVFYDFNIVD